MQLIMAHSVHCKYVIYIYFSVTFLIVIWQYSQIIAATKCGNCGMTRQPQFSVAQGPAFLCSQINIATVPVKFCYLNSFGFNLNIKPMTKLVTIAMSWLLLQIHYEKCNTTICKQPELGSKYLQCRLIRRTTYSYMSLANSNYQKYLQKLSFYFLFSSFLS